MVNNQNTILIVDDEYKTRKMLNVYVNASDFHVEEAASGKQAIRLVVAIQPDLILLDLGLPDMDGLEVIKAVREWYTVPIIVLSARGQEADIVTALELGADDYITKPFGAPELLARVNAALRHAPQPAATLSPVFERGDVSVDLEKRQVRVKGTEIHLTPTEYKLLALLVKHAGKVVTHQQLLKEVWGKNATENRQYLRIYAQHLRRKLGDNSMPPRYIITEAGVGYRFKD